MLFYCSLSLCFKSAGVPTASAKLLGGTVVGKAIVDRACAGRAQNLGKWLLVQIAKGEHTVGIQAAGHNGAVAVYAHLIAERIAKQGRSLGECGR